MRRLKVCAKCQCSGSVCTCIAMFLQTATDAEIAAVIEGWLREVSPQPLTRTEIRDLFNRNAPPGRIPRALSMLQSEGRASMETVRQPMGRPVQCWRAVTSKGATHD